jgi:hypothetical protein
MGVNELRLKNSPPVDEVCSLEYCMFEDDVPYANIVSQQSSRSRTDSSCDGPCGSTAGGDEVEVELRDLMALTRQDVSVRVAQKDTVFAAIKSFSD